MEEEEESGRASSAIEVKLEVKEDRISKLPDHLIQRILYFLPSNQAIKTGVLSKRWRNQWSRLPVLDFRYTNLAPHHYISFVDTTIILHQCSNSKIVKFYLDSCPSETNWFNSRIHFAIKKGVEELILKAFNGYMLPIILHQYASLVRLETTLCNFRSNPNWESLKTLKITRASFTKESMEGVLSGCPVLESLELICCSLSVSTIDGLFVIASKSLKIFYLDQLTNVSLIEISCPNLEELILFRCNGAQFFKFLGLPCSVCASVYHWHGCSENVAKDILRQLRHVKELKFGRSFVKILSALKVEGLSYLLLNNRCSYLTLDYLHFVDDFHGIAYALSNSPLVEKLVIKLFPRKLKHQDQFTDDLSDLGDSYWNSKRFVFNSLMSQLKTVKIIGLWERGDDCKYVLHFIQFLLKNARVLQKMVIIVMEDLWTGTDFVSKVSQKLLSIPRCSPRAKVELCATKFDSSACQS